MATFLRSLSGTNVQPLQGKRKTTCVTAVTRGSSCMHFFGLQHWKSQGHLGIIFEYISEKTKDAQVLLWANRRTASRCCWNGQTVHVAPSVALKYTCHKHLQAIAPYTSLTRYVDLLYICRSSGAFQPPTHSNGSRLNSSESARRPTLWFEWYSAFADAACGVWRRSFSSSRSMRMQGPKPSTPIWTKIFSVERMPFASRFAFTFSAEPVQR